MRRLTVALLLQLTIVSLPYAYRYALIVGQNKGGATVDDLRYAEADAQRCAVLLQKYAGFSSDNISVLLHPDSSTLTAEGERLAGKINTSEHQEQSLFLFYYSGHADGESLLLETSHVPFATLKKMFERIPAGIRIAIFDACQSGAVVAFKGGKRAEPFYLQHQQKSQGEVWIASSSAQERAQESETLKSSLFSFHLFNGLRGSADVSSDMKVTVGEAYQYAYKKTIETSALTTGIVQHPMYRFNLSGEGDIVLTDLSERKGGILIDGTCKGTFLIMSRNYTDVYADFFKPEEKEAFIALAEGEYTIINARGGTDIGFFQFTVKELRTTACTNNLFHASLLQEVRSKGVSSKAAPVETTTGDTYRAELYSFGFGGGFCMKKSGFSSEWYSTALLSLYGALRLNERLQLTVVGYGYPRLKEGGGELGVGRVGMINRGKTYFGVAVGAEYGYRSNDAERKTVQPIVTFHGGSGIDLSSKVQLGFYIPYRLSFGSGGIQRIGCEARLLFSDVFR